MLNWNLYPTEIIKEINSRAKVKKIIIKRIKPPNR